MKKEFQLGLVIPVLVNIIHWFYTSLYTCTIGICECSFYRCMRGSIVNSYDAMKKAMEELFKVNSSVSSEYFQYG